jgi:hypothetical protein
MGTRPAIRIWIRSPNSPGKAGQIPPGAFFYISGYATGYWLFLETRWSRVVKSSRFLIRTGEREQLFIFVVPAQEGDTHRCPRTTDTVIIAGIEGWRFRCIIPTQATRDNYRRMSGQVRESKLRAGASG